MPCGHITSCLWWAPWVQHMSKRGHHSIGCDHLWRRQIGWMLMPHMKIIVGDQFTYKKCTFSLLLSRHYSWPISCSRMNSWLCSYPSFTPLMVGSLSLSLALSLSRSLVRVLYDFIALDGVHIKLTMFNINRGWIVFTIMCWCHSPLYVNLNRCWMSFICFL